MDHQSPAGSAQNSTPALQMRDINQEHKDSLNGGEHLALFITDHVGTMGFFFVILGWTVIWLGWNFLAPEGLRFDPYPGFVLWLFISNMIQLMLLPLLLIGQNLQGRHSEMRTESDYEVNVHSEQEIEDIIRRLDEQHKLLEAILQRQQD